MIKKFIDDKIDLIVIATTLLAVLALFLVLGGNLFFYGGLLLILLVFAFKLKRLNYFVIPLILSIFMVISFYLRENLSGDHYKNLLNSKSTYGTFELEAKDILFTKVEGVDNSNYITCEIKRIKPFADDNWQECSGTILLFRRDLPTQFSYGDSFQITGSLQFITTEESFNFNSQDFDNHGFGDYQQYLKTNDLYAIIYPESRDDFKFLSANFSFYKIIERSRDYLLGKTVMYLKSDENKNVAAALFYGCKGALSKSMKRDFIKSGTIHLFAISGLHVALVMAVCLIGFRYLSYYYRYLVISGIVLVFVLSTGANIPAMRAFFMIFIWSLFKSSLLKISNLNLLFLTGSILLIYNPFYIIDVGFLFSFSISSMLIIIAKKYRELNQMLSLKDELIPFTVIRNSAKSEALTSKILFSLISCLVAFFASSLISLCFFGKIYMVGLFINALLIPQLIYLFYIMLVATLVNLIGLEFRYLNYLFDKTLQLFLDMCSLLGASSKNLEVGTIDVVESVIFFIGFIMLLVSRKFAMKLVALLLILALFGVNIFKSYQEPPKLLILKGEDQKISFVICEPKIRYAVVFNPNSYQNGQIIMKYLSDNSIKKIDQLILDNDNKGNFSTLALFEQNFELGTVSLLNFSKSKRRDLFANRTTQLLNRIDFRDEKNHLDKKIFKYKLTKGVYTLEYLNLATILRLKIIYDQKKKTITIFDDDTQKKIDLENSNITEIYEYEF